ncbi:hypothetical protein OY671_010327 [Metschnikowia pulcherrima]|nr:hypothetical protein OY671_010327 [Metschnikowia pulcherrima]
MKLENRRVVVTGGAGSIGSFLAERSVAAGARVVVADDFSTGRRENLSSIAGRIELREGDSEEQPAMERASADAEVVFDPFSGTGTTASCAAYRGKTGVATDINPFSIWLANAKARSYDARAIASFQSAAQLAAVSAAD